MKPLVRPRGAGSGAGRRVLMVSYDYPPVGSIGSVRTLKAVEYLAAQGWLSTVLTVRRDLTHWSAWDGYEGLVGGVKVIRAPFFDIPTLGFNLLERLVRGAKETTEGDRWSREYPRTDRVAPASLRHLARWVTFPDRYLLWLPAALALGLLETSKGDYSLIYSTSPPVTCHLVAAMLSHHSGIRWLADFRDPWVNPFNEPARLQQAVSRRLESLVLRGASAVTSVSQPLAEEISSRNPLKRVECITNGFDPREHEAIQEPDDGRFVITYTGSLFGLKRDPSTLMQVIEQLIEEGAVEPNAIAVRFYCPPEPGLERLKNRLRYPETMEICGTIPRPDCLKRQSASTVLLLLMWDHHYSRKVYGGKVFEYLGARRPILAWAPAGGIIEELLERTGAGVAASTREGLKGVLFSWLEEFSLRGGLAYRGRPGEVDQYSWEKLAVRLARVFEFSAGSALEVP